MAANFRIIPRALRPRAIDNTSSSVMPAVCAMRRKGRPVKGMSAWINRATSISNGLMAEVL